MATVIILRLAKKEAISCREREAGEDFCRTPSEKLIMIDSANPVLDNRHVMKTKRTGWSANA